MDARQEAVSFGRHEIVFLHLGTIEDAKRFTRQIDHDGFGQHRGDTTEDLFSQIERSALRAWLGLVCCRLTVDTTSRSGFTVLLLAATLALLLGWAVGASDCSLTVVGASPVVWTGAFLKPSARLGTSALLGTVTAVCASVVARGAVGSLSFGGGSFRGNCGLGANFGGSAGGGSFGIGSSAFD